MSNEFTIHPAAIHNILIPVVHNQSTWLSLVSPRDTTKEAYIDRAGRHASSILWANQRLAFVLHNPALPAGVLDVVPQLDLGTIKGSHALIDIEVLAAKPGAR